MSNGPMPNAVLTGPTIADLASSRLASRFGRLVGLSGLLADDEEVGGEERSRSTLRIASHARIWYPRPEDSDR